MSSEKRQLSSIHPPDFGHLGLLEPNPAKGRDFCVQHQQDRRYYCTVPSTGCMWDYNRNERHRPPPRIHLSRSELSSIIRDHSTEEELSKLTSTSSSPISSIKASWQIKGQKSPWNSDHHQNVIICSLTH